MEETKRVEPMVISFEDGKEYTLEFNRATVSLAETSGFSRRDAADKMMTRLPELFFFAFKMHHSSISKEKTDEILFQKLKGLTPEEIDRLTALFDAPYNTLVSSEDDTEARKNARVTVRM